MNRRLLRLLIILAIVAFWFLSTAWLVCFEAFPSLFSRATGGYRSIIAADTRLMADDWMRITYAGQHIGYTHNQMEVKDNDPACTYVINNRTVLNLILIGQPQQVGLVGTVNLDSTYKLSSFEARLTLQDNRFGLSGKHIDKSTYEITLTHGEVSTTTRVEIPEDAIIHAPTMQLALGKLKPGRTLKFKTFNPVSLSPGTILVKAIRNETITVNGEDYEATLMTWNSEGMEVKSWVDQNGRILREESPLGWSMEMCEARDAMRFDRKSFGDAAFVDPMLPQLPLQGELNHEDTETQRK